MAYNWMTNTYSEEHTMYAANYANYLQNMMAGITANVEITG